MRGVAAIFSVVIATTVVRSELPPFTNPVYIEIGEGLTAARDGRSHVYFYYAGMDIVWELVDYDAGVKYTYVHAYDSPEPYCKKGSPDLEEPADGEPPLATLKDLERDRWELDSEKSPCGYQSGVCKRYLTADGDTAYIMSEFEESFVVEFNGGKVTTMDSRGPDSLWKIRSECL